MSFKIKLPKVSNEFYQALGEKIIQYPKETRGSHFWETLSEVSRAIQTVEIRKIMGNLGGADTVFTTDPFLLAVEKEFLRLHELGYSGGDFQLILLDAWLLTSMNIVLAPCFQEELAGEGDDE